MWIKRLYVDEDGYADYVSIEPDRKKQGSNVIGTCHICGEYILFGEQYAKTEDGKMIHCRDSRDDYCIDEEWDKLTAEEKAEKLGYEVVT